ncbi:hypothetical protein BOO71_0010894 [Deinococcus marmoris]|uniref:Uncharacterized protein n=1 Tax=Deinococcus marmoris TaxID=249408 RepID=A0A1U7NV06_9DEIO|nr:hypothetical protein BOO71_0010894 [Deinococcus marmoris]
MLAPLRGGQVRADHRQPDPQRQLGLPRGAGRQFQAGPEGQHRHALSPRRDPEHVGHRESVAGSAGTARRLPVGQLRHAGPTFSPRS